MPTILPSPAIAFVGRHNSGKTTLVEKLIAKLSMDGYDVGSIKHHGHAGFEIDIPGKDSYRHRAAGATETYIVAPGQMAMVKTIPGDMECDQIVSCMPGHDIVIVEGYRLSGLPTFEIMRMGNERDHAVAHAFFNASLAGAPLSCDILQLARESGELTVPALADDLAQKMPGASTVAIVSDIPIAAEAAKNYGIPCFHIDDVSGIASYLIQEHVRPRLTVAIQAGGESKRMGQSKATVPFAGRPLIMRVVERVMPVADEIVITTNEPDHLAFLLDAYPYANIRFATDEQERRGALPGLLTAFKSASYPCVAVVACDMVNVSAKLIAYEYGRMIETGADVCIPLNSHGREPFHALYARDACLRETERLVCEGQNRAQAILSSLHVVDVPQSEVYQVEPGGGCFVNVNTPEELAKAERQFVQTF